MERRNLIFLALVVFIGFILRFALLTYNPPSLNWDEVSHGYNAYSVLKTGMDQWGQKFPVFNFRAYGDYPATLNLYLTIPFIMIFGLTEFAIRFPHALLGALTVISVYFLSWGLTKNKNVSLVAAGLAAIGPWYIFTSRFVLQSNLSVFLLTAAGALFFNREKKKYFLPLSLFLLTFTLFSYHTTRIFSPLLILGGLLIYRPRSWKVGAFAILFFVLTLIILKNPESRARGGVLFLVDQGAVSRIVELRNSSELPDTIKRLVYNRPVYFIVRFSKNYISYFSPKFLFFEGGTQYQFSIPNTGLIFPVNLPFFYLGLMVLVIKALRDKNYRLLLLWLVISPIPASITNESYAVVRATTMLPVPEIVISLGLFAALSRVKLRYVGFGLIVYFALIYLSAENYLLNYFTSYRTNYSWSWQYGYKEAVNYAKNNYQNYDKILVTKKYGEPHEFFLFFLGYDPKKYQDDQNAIRFYQSNWYWVDRFDKFYFINDWQIVDKTGINKVFALESKSTVDCRIAKCLLITSPGNVPQGWKRLQAVKFLDGGAAFEIYDNK